MPLVTVTGSNFDPRVAVTDFSTSGGPSTVFVTPEFPEDGPPPSPNGCVVACSRLLSDGDVSSSLAAVGQYGGGYVAIYDVANPSAPQQIGMFDTGLGTPLSGIGSISLYGTNVLAGELNGSNVSFIDINDPNPPNVYNTSSGGGFSSVVLIGSTAITCSSFNVIALNYANPAAPQFLNSITPPPSEIPGEPVPLFTCCDFDGSTVAVAYSDGGVGAFSAELSPIADIENFETAFTSIAVQSGDDIQIAGASYGGNSVQFFTVGEAPDPDSAGLVILNSEPGFADGPLAFYGLANLFAGSNNGQGLTWYNTMLWPNWGPDGPPVVSVAENANLNTGQSTTLGVAFFPTLRFFPPWPLPRVPGWLAQWLFQSGLLK